MNLNLNMHNDYIACKKIDVDQEKKLGCNIIINCENGLPKYEVIETGINVTACKKGDVVVINSNPTKVNFDGEDIYLSSGESIIGTVVKATVP